MNIPELDTRTKQDLINQIKKNSLTYTPEWRFDEQNPDVGTALAIIYANMMSDTVNRFNKVLELNRVSFFNKIGAKLLPAICAKGYATFSLVNDDMSGVEVRKGTKLSAEVEGEEESVIFETVNDLFVTPAELNHIYLADSEEDQIIHLYEQEAFEVNPAPFYIFNRDGINLQTHEMYFSHDYLFDIEHEAWIMLSIFPFRAKEIPKTVIDALLNPSIVSIEYYSEDGYIEFVNRKFENGTLMLQKGKHQKKFELTQHMDTESYFIKLTVKDIKVFRDFVIENIAIRTKGDRIEPELVNVDGVDQKIKEFYPFGERPSPYSELYFVSKEALGKKGAMISFSFHLDYVKIPLEIQQEEQPIKWKSIMKRSDFKTDKEYDITIDEIVWEYYNGEGWSRLYVNNQFAKVFSGTDMFFGQMVTINFQCPKNISPFLINSLSSYSIRARILKMSNLFKLKGSYITPVITNPSFKYDYINNDILPMNITFHNNLEVRMFTDKEWMKQTPIMEPFYGLKEEALTMYYGFELPPVGGPIKILFSTIQTLNEKLPRLNYEYYGNGRWQVLNVVDETERLRKTGVLTMMGTHDFGKKLMFGRELYWIRTIDVEHGYLSRKNENVPCISGIHINSTGIEQEETKEPERFHIEAREENKVCKLMYQQISRTTVWVNEIKNIHDRELALVEKNGKVRNEYDENGQREAIWVKWTETDSFALSGPDDRHYVVDRINGSVIFSDGRNGRIPSNGEEETILVEYSCGGGSRGNLEAARITTMDRAIGFINDVTNHEITTGGNNQETVNEALLRNAAAIKHGYRAVTASDYEALALEASRNILHAKCITNCNSNVEREYGSITLVILQKDYNTGRKYFDHVKAQVISYIGPRMSSNLLEMNKFHVVEPRFIEIRVNASVVVNEYDQVFDVKKKILQRMKEFIDPTTGNFDHRGWGIGSVPNSTQILNALKDIKEILFIKNVNLSGYIRGVSGLLEVDLERKEANRFVLPVNGIHEIFVEVK